MVHYKLEYFDVRGLGEVARQLFALAGVEYENVTYTLGSPEWEARKPTTPFGHIPILTVDGVVIAESAAIARYLGRKFGFAGKTPEEEAWVDAIVDQYKDFGASFRPLIMAQRFGKPEEEVNKIRQEVFLPGRDAYFKILNKTLSKSKSGFLVGDGVTFADLFVVDNLTTLANLGLYTPSEQPQLEALHKKVTSIPALKKWIDKRPETPL